MTPRTETQSEVQESHGPNDEDRRTCDNPRLYRMSLSSNHIPTPSAPTDRRRTEVPARSKRSFIRIANTYLDMSNTEHVLADLVRHATVNVTLNATRTNLLTPNRQGSRHRSIAYLIVTHAGIFTAIAKSFTSGAKPKVWIFRTPLPARATPSLSACA